LTADAAALAAALTALANPVANLNNNNNNAAAARHVVHQPLLDQFDLPPLTSLRGLAPALSLQPAPPSMKHGTGTINTPPSIIITLRIHSSEVKWNTTAPQGILTITGHDLLTDYHTVPDDNLNAACTARNDPQAIQNSRAMHKCLKSSITGDLHATIFDQTGNLPGNEDGPTLFKKLTTFTMVASLQQSMLSFKNILEFDPTEHTFNIPMINTKLILF
jgi:hypothetical protein